MSEYRPVPPRWTSPPSSTRCSTSGGTTRPSSSPPAAPAAAALDVLRGSADRQRPARHPPRRGPGLQGPLPPLQDDAGLPRRPQGRLGLPRPARRARRREGARLLRQAATSRPTASPSSTPGAASRSAPRRPFEEMTERMGYWVDTSDPYRTMDPAYVESRLVGAQADPRPGPARRGLPRRAVLPALRHRALGPRAGAGLRDRHRPERLRAASR